MFDLHETIELLQEMLEAPSKGCLNASKSRSMSPQGMLESLQETLELLRKIHKLVDDMLESSPPPHVMLELLHEMVELRHEMRKLFDKINFST